MKFVQILYKLGQETPESLQKNKLKLSKLFKVPATKIEELFTHRPVVLMAKVEFERAKRFYLELQRHGIPCIAKPWDAAPSPPAVDYVESENQKNKILKIYEHLLSHWFRDRVWLMVLVLVVLPAMFVGIPLSNMLLTKDYHIAYFGKRNGALCADFQPVMQGRGTVKKYEKKMYQDYLRRYKATTNPAFVGRYGHKVCRIDYLLQIGNVGRKPVQSISMDLDFAKLGELIPDSQPRRHILTKVREGKNSGSLTKVSHGDTDNYIIRDLAVGAVVELRFRAYYKRGNPYYEAPELITAVRSDQGKVEAGSPEVSALERLLGFTQ